MEKCYFNLSQELLIFKCKSEAVQFANVAKIKRKEMKPHNFPKSCQCPIALAFNFNDS